MGDSDKGSIISIDLGDWSKPANTLIKKCDGALGELFKPHQIVRVAQAEVEADKIRAVGQIEITDLQRRAVTRFVAEEAKKQQNIEAIMFKALPDVSADAKPEEVEDDWISNFFDKSRLISDEEMQSLWAKILAGEANTPGGFSKRTVNLVASLDKSDAALFSSLCSFVFYINGAHYPVVLDCQDQIYQRAGLPFPRLAHLESAGLIHFSVIPRFTLTDLGRNTPLHLADQRLVVRFPGEYPPYKLDFGEVVLTRAGLELGHLSGAQPTEGLLDYVKGYWGRSGLQIEGAASAAE